MKKIGVIDGQGGGIGSTIIKKIKELYGETVDVVALGTNAIATAQMLKAGANRGASGENAIVQTTKSVDVILGPLGIIIAHAMMGEVTPGIAEGVAGSPAAKIIAAADPGKRDHRRCRPPSIAAPDRRVDRYASAQFRHLIG